MINLKPVRAAIRMLQRSVTLKRPAAGDYVDGVWQGGGTDETTIMAAICPVTNADLMRLPEGLRIDATHIIWSETELRAADEATKTTSDVIVNPLGQEFSIIKVAYRDEAGFYRAVGTLKYDRGRSI